MGPQIVGVILGRNESVRFCLFEGIEPFVADNFANRQPILADEVQTFKALITIHKVLQEGHPVVLKEAQSNTGWLDSLKRGVVHGDGVRGE